MNSRPLRVVAIAVTAIALFVPAAQASFASPPLPDPRPRPAVQSDSSADVSALLRQLVAEYASTHENRTHNEVELLLNDPVRASL